MICALKDLQEGGEFIYQEEGHNKGKRRKVIRNLRGDLIIVDKFNNKKHTRFYSGADSGENY